jgi:hypothetical protein
MWTYEDVTTHTLKMMKLSCLWMIQRKEHRTLKER